MIKILFEENLAAYIIFGIFVIGIVFKIFLRVSLKSLIDQSDNLHATNKNILKQIKLKYESLIRLNQEVFNVKAFINKFLFKYKCIGIPVKRMGSVSKVIDLLCLALGVLVGAFAYINYQNINYLVFYIAQGLVLSILGYMIRSMIDIDGNWDLIETNLQDYLENNLRNKFTTEGRKSDELVAKRLMTGELETGYEKRQELEIVSEPEETESIDVRDIQKNVFNNRVIEEILKEYLV